MRSNFLWLCFLLLTFIVTLPATWWVIAKADFFYSSLYDSMEIDKHIELYARQSDQKNIQLFTEAEIIHLQDVANLLDKVKPIVLFLTLLWFVVVFWLCLKRQKKCLINYMFGSSQMIISGTSTMRIH